MKNSYILNKYFKLLDWTSNFLAPSQHVNSSGSVDGCMRGNGHPGDNPFYSNIDSMPDIRPRRKSIPLVSELVSTK
uniref:Uncharacterized protein n=1 Tax=Glossina palpalis gambiensis TaxID=67801 RepID=A0A1B0BWK0_9MUSC